MKKLFLLLTFCFLFAQENFSQCGTTVSGTLSFCGQACDGIVNFTPSSGTPPYNIVITGGPSAQFTGIYTWSNVCPGSYHYDITDATLSCNDTGTVVVTGLPLPIIFNPGPASICSGGSIQISVSGASTYSWSPSIGLSSTTSATVIASPTATITYTVTGTSVDGCTSTTAITVIVNPNPVIIMNVTNASCWTCCDGSITAQGAIVYQWSTGATTSTINGLCVGVYTVWATDMNGCSGSAVAVVDTGAVATVVQITNANDNAQSYCSAPFSAQFAVSGYATGYSATDSITIYQNFGDGNDTTFLVPILNSIFYGSYNHTYQFPGAYSCVYIATAPDGRADTITRVNDVIGYSSCGNIEGRLYIDANANCIYDFGEVALSNIPVQLLLNTNVVATAYTGSNGYYYFFMPNNNYTVQPGPQLANYGYTVTCPPSGQINIPSVPSLNNNFGVMCSPSFDLSASLTCPGYRPGFVSYIYPAINNINCQSVSGQAKLILSNPNLSVVSTSVTPNVVSGDTLIWNFSNLTNASSVYLGVVGVMTSLSAVIGDTICVTLIVEPIAGDANAADNTVTVCRPVTNSYDPNDKNVNPQGDVVSGSWLTYTIRFQNTGNDTAYNVFLIDTISSHLDMNTFQPVGASHTYETFISSGNIVKFAFDNIMLADSIVNEPLSHGWITYRIKTFSSLTTGTTVNNTAYIYFDFNPAIVTNTTATVIDNTVSVGDESFETGSIFIYPNPAANQLAISNKQFAIESVEVYDVLGKKILIQRLSTNNEQLTIDISHLVSGMYFVKVRGEKANKVVKFVKQ